MQFGHRRQADAPPSAPPRTVPWRTPPNHRIISPTKSPGCITQSTCRRRSPRGCAEQRPTASRLFSCRIVSAGSKWTIERLRLTHRCLEEAAKILRVRLRLDEQRAPSSSIARPRSARKRARLSRWPSGAGRRRTWWSCCAGAVRVATATEADGGLAAAARVSRRHGAKLLLGPSLLGQNPPAQPGVLAAPALQDQARWRRRQPHQPIVHELVVMPNGWLSAPRAAQR